MVDEDRAGEQPDAAGAAARSMTQLAQQMREMAERMLSGGLPGWPVPGVPKPAEPLTARSDAGRAASPQPDPDRSRPGADRTVPGLPAIPGMPPMPGLPATPVTMSARQLQAIVDDIAARRSQVKALVAQLELFDEQLGTLEASLQPLLQWLRTWADLEGAVADFWTPKKPR
jgi:hypothetical protein